MFKDKLVKISTKALYIAFSLLVSFSLWMFVELYENDELVREITGVEVDTLNMDVLRSRGLLITSIEPETVSITFEGPRTEISRLTASGAVKVEIDLAGITSIGTAHLSYEVVYPTRVNTRTVNIVASSPARITLEIDRELEKPIPVRVNYTGGTASDELIAEAVEYDPQTIMVRGSEIAVSQISYIYVPILIENLSGTYVDDLEFELYDENDERLDDSLRESLIFSQETIRVTIPIREIKDIPLTVELSHASGTSAQNTSIEIQPRTIKVSGDPDSIRDFNNIMLGTIDMSRFDLTTTEAFSIIVPNHLTNISGETEALVSVDVLGLEIAYISTSNLQTINTPAGYRDEILTQSLDVRIRGAAEDLINLTPMNIRVVADLRDMGTGTTWVQAKVFIYGTEADVGAVGDYRITVTVARE